MNAPSRRAHRSRSCATLCHCSSVLYVVQPSLPQEPMASVEAMGVRTSTHERVAGGRVLPMGRARSPPLRLETRVSQRGGPTTTGAPRGNSSATGGNLPCTAERPDTSSTV